MYFLFRILQGLIIKPNWPRKEFAALITRMMREDEDSWKSRNPRCSGGFDFHGNAQHGRKEKFIDRQQSSETNWVDRSECLNLSDQLNNTSRDLQHLRSLPEREACGFCGVRRKEDGVFGLDLRVLRVCFQYLEVQISGIEM
eukprot:scaffold1130_cov195-Pinguiococcus_pyrenoidosus.AAC.69